MTTRLLWRARFAASSSPSSVADANIIGVSALRALSCAIAIPLPTIVSFWQSHGMSYSEIMWLEAFFAFCCLLFEVPGGYLADHFARKQLLTTGGAFVLAGIVVYLFGENFTEFLAAELILAIGFCCISGADEAVLYDSLANNEKAHLFSRYWSRALSSELAAGSFGFVIGGLVAASYGVAAPFYAAALVQCLYIGVSLFLVEPKRTREQSSDGHLQEILSCGKEVLIENQNSRWLILVTAVVFSFSQAGFWLYQPYFKEVGVPLGYNGFILATLGLGASYFAIKIPKLEKRFGFRPTLLTLVGLSSTVFFCLGVFQSTWVLPLLFIHQGVRAFQRVVLSERLHRHVNSDRRATSVSVKNIVAEGSYALLMFGVGPLVDLLGVSNTLLGLGLGFLLVTMLVHAPLYLRR